MEDAMQHGPSTAVDRSFSGTSENRPEVRFEANRIDPADIYRRLDRRPAPRPIWMTAVAIAVLAVVAAGAVIVFQDDLRPPAAHVQVLTPGSVSRS
jgi:hypothetical protein